MNREIWTIGHSTRSGEEFLRALTAHRIEVLADVRRFPHSRRNPEFNTDPLKRSLFPTRIRYEYLGDELGGFRKANAHSPHLALLGSSFQGYADHLGTPLYRKGFERLRSLLSGARVAVMCSERQPKDCHRRILADHLSIQGTSVRHILDVGEAFEHVLTPTLRLVEGELLYAPAPLEEFPGPS